MTYRTFSVSLLVTAAAAAGDSKYYYYSNGADWGSSVEGAELCDTGKE